MQPPVHVLRRRVGDDVAAEAERTAEDRSREGVVDDERHAVLVGDLRELGDVENAAGGVRHRLAEDALGVGAEGLLDLLLARVGVDEGELDAELLQRDREEVEGAAVDLRRGDDVVAGVAEVEDRESRRGLAGRGENRGDAALERGDLLSHHVVGRVRKAGVEVAGRL